MSKFFNVTLDSDVVLDDGSVSSSAGWSSEKILNEIVDHRVTKFEELDDVDVVNKKDKQAVVFSESTGKFTTIDFEQLSDDSGLSLKQISKMGVTGTTTTPQIIDVPISTVDFKVPKLNILKFILGDQNVIKTENSFSSSENIDFVSDDKIILDGTAHLKTNFQSNMAYDSDVESYKSYGVSLDSRVFKSISNLNVKSSGADKILDITAIPLDRILIPNSDLNVSNASNIDNFTLTASGSALKVVCSVDSGVKWKVFKNNNWIDVNLTVDDLKSNGMDLATFNSVTSTYWNMLITTNKIRFAYLMADNNAIDEIKLQYDAQGYWIEAKPTDYDVVYSSNSLLQVKLYFSGDEKINY